MDDEAQPGGGTFMRIPLEQISIEEGRRIRGDLSSLMESMRTVGQIQPIIVTPDHRLVVGFHRVEAARALGWTRGGCTGHGGRHGYV